MTKTYYFKVGSMPGERCRIVRKRIAPKVGEIFRIHYQGRVVSVRCKEIRDLGNETLFVVDRY